MSAGKAKIRGERSHRTARKLSASLMNDTKWREVWEILTDLRLRFYIAFLGHNDWNVHNSAKLQGPFSRDYVLERGIRDPGIGGPFLYKHIQWIQVPKIRGNNVDEFSRRLEVLGRLPVFIDSNFLEIRGYHVA